MTEEKNNIKTKIWTTIATFITYEEALAHKESVLTQYDLVKIRALNRNKKQWSYKVKAWTKPAEKPKKKTSKKNKK